MKRIKVIATLFILFSASLMNYHDQPVSSVNYVHDAKMILCAQKCHAQEIKPCSQPETDYSGTEQPVFSGKNYEATMVIM
jgi:hypothetical protein